jgi:hypothetical protein
MASLNGKADRVEGDGRSLLSEAVANVAISAASVSTARSIPVHAGAKKSFHV